jgi:hypothetical protein
MGDRNIYTRKILHGRRCRTLRAYSTRCRLDNSQADESAARAPGESSRKPAAMGGMRCSAGVESIYLAETFLDGVHGESGFERGDVRFDQPVLSGELCRPAMHPWLMVAGTRDSEGRGGRSETRPQSGSGTRSGISCSSGRPRKFSRPSCTGRQQPVCGSGCNEAARYCLCRSITFADRPQACPAVRFRCTATGFGLIGFMYFARPGISAIIRKEQFLPL